MPLNHLKVIIVTVNPTPPKPAGSKLLISTCFYLNTRYTYPLCVQLQHQHFSGWWSVQYIFPQKQCQEHYQHFDSESKNVWSSVPHQYPTAMLPTLCAVNKQFCEYIYQTKGFHFEYQSVSRKNNNQTVQFHSTSGSKIFYTFFLHVMFKSCNAHVKDEILNLSFVKLIFFLNV